MEDDTTTSVATDAGGEQPQPVEAAPTEAVETTPVVTENEAEEASASAPDEDAELAKWATAKGLELDSDNAKKAAKMARESEKAMHAKGQKASELEKASQITAAEMPADATAQDTSDARVRNLEIKYEVQEWKMNNPEKAAAEADMAKFVTDNPAKGLLLKQGYLSLDDVYAMSVGASNTATVKSQGKREALESLAHKQQAAVPTGNATTTGQPRAKAFKDLSIKEMEKKLGIVSRG